MALWGEGDKGRYTERLVSPDSGRVTGYPDVSTSRILTPGWPTTPELALLWFAFQRLANREQEDGTLAFRVRRKEVSHVIIEEGQPCRTQALGIRSQGDLAADDARLQLDGPVAAGPI